MSLWVLNADQDTLVNLESGQRLVMVPVKRPNGEEVYSLVVQAPGMLPANFTTLLREASREDCQNLLMSLDIRLAAWRIPRPPILIDWEERTSYILILTDYRGQQNFYICADEETAKLEVASYVRNRWPHSFLSDRAMPADPYDLMAEYYAAYPQEKYQLTTGVIVNWHEVKDSPNG